MYKNALKTEQLEMLDKRNKYDQFNTLVSVVDKFLFNEFTISQLCKIKLDFIAILCLKKEYMQANFDEHTLIEIDRFEQQASSLVMHDVYL